ncbi:DNA polymerase IV [Undibacterium sp. WLHG33]|uniref:DNA polymerase IV n=1 Tax=Undibacterium sp. WLHG33 TaxID=3412482 RepID=UPI003C2ED749
MTPTSTLNPELIHTRRIAHLDMDAFYASVELLRYPELKGHPVVIGGRQEYAPIVDADGSRRFFYLKNYAGRGVATTSTYEARALGVFSAMGLMKAAQLAPDAFLLPANFDAYRHYSRLFKNAVASIAPEIEDRGIDEIYIDLSSIPEESATLAARIKQAVVAATGLSCSICVAPNKLLAKIGSELDKPNGLTILNEADIPQRIWPLPVKKINGIGPKAAEQLLRLNIVTIGQLADADPELLQNTFGRNYALWLYNSARGIDEREITTSSAPKVISRETTFERDLHAHRDRETLSVIFTDLCKRVSNDLRNKGYVCRTIGIKVRYADFRVATRDIRLPATTASAEVIRRYAGECVRRLPLDQKLRLLGVKASNLSKAGADEDKTKQLQIDLFN